MERMNTAAFQEASSEQDEHGRRSRNTE